MPPSACALVCSSPTVLYEVQLFRYPGCEGRTRYLLHVDDRGFVTHLARSAELEAASVPAFEQMARELRAHGAPGSLRGRARRAALDEVRHARDVARLARSLGGRPEMPRVEQLSRSLGTPGQPG